MFREGQKVRLKNSPYEGTVKGGDYAFIKFTDELTGKAIWVAPDLLEEVVEPPQVGDIYRDKNGDEWVAVVDTLCPGEIIVNPVDRVRGWVRGDAMHFYTKPMRAAGWSIAHWHENYAPVLIRRRP